MNVNTNIPVAIFANIIVKIDDHQTITTSKCNLKKYVDMLTDVNREKT